MAPNQNPGVFRQRATGILGDDVDDVFEGLETLGFEGEEMVGEDRVVSGRQTRVLGFGVPVFH